MNLAPGAAIGYVPQFLHFDPSLPITVSDFFLLMLRRTPLFLARQRAARGTIRTLLAQTESQHLMDRLIGKLSGGEFRRVLLAQALAPQPELLLLDEPASNVDPQGAQLFEQILLRLRDQAGITILMVGHDVGMVLRCADRVTGINRRVSFDGSPRQLDEHGRLAELYGAAAPLAAG